MRQNNIRKLLEKHPVIPVVTFNHLDEVVPQIEKLRSQGVNCIEITLRTDIAFDAIAFAIEKFGTSFDVGVGTIVNESQIQKASELGVAFMVSPGINASLSKSFEDSKIPFIPGVATPSEIIQGIQLGWDTFKFFPAQLFGGYNALTTYGQVFPEIRFCPTGGINESNYKDYLALTNVISVGGSWLK